MIIDKYELEELIEKFGEDYIEHNIDDFYEWLDRNDNYKQWLNDKDEEDDVYGIDRSYREWRYRNE